MNNIPLTELELAVWMWSNLASSLITPGKAEVHTAELLHEYASHRDVPYTVRKLGRS